MSLSITLTDDTMNRTYTEAKIGAPLTISDDKGMAVNKVLNGNIYVDFVYRKQQLELHWDYMNDEDYAEIRGFYDRQFSSLKFPRVSIPELGIDNMVAYLDIGNREIVNHCLLTKSVKITLRETTQQ